VKKNADQKVALIGVFPKNMNTGLLQTRDPFIGMDPRFTSSVIHYQIKPGNLN
jgi:hypothetical protein